MSSFHQAKRVPVTAQWLWEHPDVQGYIFNREADDLGLDPWQTINGMDALTRDLHLILETGRTGEKIVVPEYEVYVSEKKVAR